MYQLIISWLLSKIASAVLFDISLGQGPIFLEDNLGVTEWAVFELEVFEFLMQGFVLANLAHVVLFHHNAHSTRNAWRVVRTAILTVYVKFGDALAAFWAGTLLLIGLVDWRVSREEFNCQEFIRFSLILGNGIESFQLDEGSAALSEATIEERGDGYKAVHIFCL